MTIKERLYELRDEGNAAFQHKITPTLPISHFLGVRLPNMRKLAKELVRSKDEGIEDFLKTLPHDYFDENLLHVLLLNEIKDYDACVSALDKFLPYVDNWAVCDTISPKPFKKNRERLIVDISRWMADEKLYTCRHGIHQLMNHFLDEDFAPEQLETVAEVYSEEYYIKMMQAWYFATALAKQWDTTIGYITEGRLETWVHNKSIQKARESFRITPEQKEYLKTLKK